MGRRSKDPNVPATQWRESRNEIKTRLMREGRWEAYKARREELRKEMPMHLAHQQAALEFPPLPEGMVATTATPPTPESAASTPKAPPPPDDSFEADVTPDQRPAKDPKAPRITEREIIRWVGENVRTEGLTINDAPCGAAYALYHACRRDTDMERSYWTNMWTKLLPSQRELDEQSKFDDQGTHVLNALDAVAQYNAMLASHSATLAPPPPHAPPHAQPQTQPPEHTERSPIHTRAAIIIRPNHDPGARPQPRTGQEAW